MSFSLLGLRGLQKVIPYWLEWISDPLINSVTTEISHSQRFWFIYFKSLNQTRNHKAAKNWNQTSRSAWLLAHMRGCKSEATLPNSLMDIKDDSKERLLAPPYHPTYCSWTQLQEAWNMRHKRVQTMQALIWVWFYLFTVFEIWVLNRKAEAEA